MAKLTIRLTLDSGHVAFESVDEVVTEGSQYYEHKQVITTGASQSINMASMPAGCLVCLQNKDATNFITVEEVSTTTKALKLKPGRSAVLPYDPTVTTLKAFADTASCLLQISAVQQA